MINVKVIVTLFYRNSWVSGTAPLKRNIALARKSRLRTFFYKNKGALHLFHLQVSVVFLLQSSSVVYTTANVFLSCGGFMHISLYISAKELSVLLDFISYIVWLFIQTLFGIVMYDTTNTTSCWWLHILVLFLNGTMNIYFLTVTLL